MWVKVRDKLIGWSQESSGSDQRGDLMVSPAVEDNLLGPCTVPVKGSEPDPLPCLAGDVHVGKVLDCFSSKSSKIINEDGVIWIVSWIGKL